MVDGVVVIDKPKGVTSFWVVQKVRRILGQRKVGHAGTLDPLATGVLPVCLGRATKIVQFLMEGDKTYVGTMTLGKVTDTYDADGEVVEEFAIPSLLQKEYVQELAQGFVGNIMQEPPPFSAAKHKGQPLYKLARKGIKVKKEPREIRVFSFQILKVEPPYVDFEIRCSKGTYVRSLVNDLGRLIGFGAFLSSLKRTANGPFTIEEAITLEALEEAAREGRLDEVIMPVSRALEHLPAVEVDREMAGQIRKGIPIVGSYLSDACHRAGVGGEGGFVRLVCGKELVAVIPWDRIANASLHSLVRPVKVWPHPDQVAAL